MSCLPIYITHDNTTWQYTNNSDVDTANLSTYFHLILYWEHESHYIIKIKIKNKTIVEVLSVDNIY